MTVIFPLEVTMLQQLIKLAESDEAIRRGKKNFSADDLLPPISTNVGENSTAAELREAYADDEIRAHEIVSVTDCLCVLNQLGYLKMNKQRFVFLPRSYASLKRRLFKGATSK